MDDIRSEQDDDGNIHMGGVLSDLSEDTLDFIGRAHQTMFSVAAGRPFHGQVLDVETETVAVDVQTEIGKSELVLAPMEKHANSPA